MRPGRIILKHACSFVTSDRHVSQLLAADVEEPITVAVATRAYVSALSDNLSVAKDEHVHIISMDANGGNQLIARNADGNTGYVDSSCLCINKGLLAFGCSLTEYCSQVRAIPIVLSECIRFLEANNGLRAEGIFRVPGAATEVLRLKKAFEDGANPLRDKLQPSPSVYSVAGLLKTYLRNLPQSLVPTKLQQLVLGQESEMSAIREALCNYLPAEHLVVLRSLIRFLAVLASHQDENLSRFS